MDRGDGSSQAEKGGLIERKAEEFHQVLDGAPQLKALAHNPLLLAIACLIFEQRSELPKRQVDLYDAYIEEWLLHWRKTGKQVLDTDVQLDLMEHLAFRLLEGGKQEFTERELLAETRAYLKLPETDPLATAIVDEILRTSGLIMQEGTSRHRFLHLTFQEYLAAKRLRGIWQGTKDLSAFLQYDKPQEYYSRWRDAIVFMSEMIPDPEELIRQNLQMVVTVEDERGAWQALLIDYVPSVYKNDNCWRFLMQTLMDPHASKRYVAVSALLLGLDPKSKYHMNQNLIRSFGEALLDAARQETSFWVLKALHRVIVEGLFDGLNWLSYNLVAEMLSHSDLTVRVWAAALLTQAGSYGGRLSRRFVEDVMTTGLDEVLFTNALVSTCRSEYKPLASTCTQSVEVLLEHASGQKLPVDDASRYGRLPYTRATQLRRLSAGVYCEEDPLPDVPECLRGRHVLKPVEWKTLRQVILSAWQAKDQATQEVAAGVIWLFHDELLLPDAIDVLGNADVLARLAFVRTIMKYRPEVEWRRYAAGLNVIQDLNDGRDGKHDDSA